MKKKITLGILAVFLWIGVAGAWSGGSSWDEFRLAVTDLVYSIVPHSNNNVSLGSSSKAFKKIWTYLLDLKEGNITNVGDIAVDSISADGTNIDIDSPLKTDRFLDQDTNTFLGIGAGSASLSHTSGDQGYYNTVIGSTAGNAITTGYYNTLYGYNAGGGVTTGSSLVFIGENAGGQSIIATNAVAVGRFAGEYISHYTTAIGAFAGWKTTGINNTIGGESAGQFLSSGEENAIWGKEAGMGVSTQGAYYRNSLFGAYAGNDIISGGNNNSLFGNKAGDSITTGSGNIVMGYDVDTPTATTDDYLNIGDKIYGTIKTAIAGADPKLTILPKLYLQGTGALSDGSANTKATYIDADPTGEWTSADADMTASADTTYYKDVTNSLKVAIVDAAIATDVIATRTVASEDWTNRESLGLWVYSTVALSAGDVDIRITDGTQGDTDIDIPAVSANTWTWVEIDITDITGMAVINKDDVDGISFIYAVDKGAMSIYFDFLCRWDIAQETDLTQSILQDGMLSAIANPVVESGAMAWVNQAEYTDYFINYTSGTDNLVVITNESANCFILQYCFE